jgi:hypothetical protein
VHSLKNIDVELHHQIVQFGIFVVLLKREKGEILQHISMVEEPTSSD